MDVAVYIVTESQKKMLAMFVVGSDFKSQFKEADQDDKLFSEFQDLHCNKLPSFSMTKGFCRK
ncbi:unnamed protein product [Sphenostylis stenocarpa]|uniref:Uncharacterized protein n=1 Tax=Sphenostylis stenocarpa TaxID=92480 RepID=A0AA86S7U7_9FABA|nr:unnamed protein product [Sphenostylis stenocarpa]